MLANSMSGNLPNDIFGVKALSVGSSVSKIYYGYTHIYTHTYIYIYI